MERRCLDLRASFESASGKPVKTGALECHWNVASNIREESRGRLAHPNSEPRRCMTKISYLLLAELDREAVGIRRTPERVREGKSEWKRHEKSMPSGYLAKIVATIPA